jgi:hypothetical protein
MAAFLHPGDSELADVGPLWGIFAHPPRGQPPAADRRAVIPVNAVAVTHKRKPKQHHPIATAAILKGRGGLHR